jgi:predicted  nucleic acid-binding Zn-ribbon protein
MAKKIKEEKDSAGNWRVWYEITEIDDEKPEATMFKFDKQPTDAEVEKMAATLIAKKQKRKNKENELEALRRQVTQLEADLNL